MPHNDTSPMVSLHAAEAEQTVAPLRRRLRWRLRGRFPEGELASAPYAPLIRHLLWHRGARTSAEAAATMEGAQVAYDAMLLPDAAPALARGGGVL